MASDLSDSDAESVTTITFPLRRSPEYYERLESAHRANPHPAFRPNRPVGPPVANRLARRRAELAAERVRRAKVIAKRPRRDQIAALLAAQQAERRTFFATKITASWADVLEDVLIHPEHYDHDEEETRQSLTVMLSVPNRQKRTMGMRNLDAAATKHRSTATSTRPRDVNKKSRNGDKVVKRRSPRNATKRVELTGNNMTSYAQVAFVKPDSRLPMTMQTGEIRTRSGRVSRKPVRWVPDVF